MPFDGIEDGNGSRDAIAAEEERKSAKSHIIQSPSERDTNQMDQDVIESLIWQRSRKAKSC